MSAGGGAGLPVLARRTVEAGLTRARVGGGGPGVGGRGGAHERRGPRGRHRLAASCATAGWTWRPRPGARTTPGRLAFGYRTSSVAPSQVVVGATFGVRRGDADEGRAALSEIVRWRRQHQPGGSNAGSVFTNPPGDSAGRLVEAAGLKGFALGTARVSEKHANFIQADDGGSADDVWRLTDHVRAAGGRAVRGGAQRPRSAWWASTQPTMGGWNPGARRAVRRAGRAGEPDPDRRPGPPAGPAGSRSPAARPAHPPAPGRRDPPAGPPPAGGGGVPGGPGRGGGGRVVPRALEVALGPGRHRGRLGPHPAGRDRGRGRPGRPPPDGRRRPRGGGGPAGAAALGAQRHGPAPVARRGPGHRGRGDPGGRVGPARRRPAGARRRLGCLGPGRPGRPGAGRPPGPAGGPRAPGDAGPARSAGELAGARRRARPRGGGHPARGPSRHR